MKLLTLTLEGAVSQGIKGQYHLGHVWSGVMFV